MFPKIALHLDTGRSSQSANINEKVKQSHYRPEMSRGYQEVKVPRFHDNVPGWW